MKNTCETENNPKTFKEFIYSKAFIKSVLSIVIGGIIGFLYYHFVGCSTGSCGITSNPFSSIGLGAFLGFFVVNKPCKSC